MAYGSMDYHSDCLKRVVSFKFILPDENPDATHQTMRLLILLHGYNGINAEWMLNSQILRLAEQYHICVVMPSGENSFYLDGTATGRQYASFIGEELPDYIRKVFRVSQKREDTWVGGFSMGGFGAIHTALRYPETFSGMFALSSALIADEVMQMRDGKGNDIANYDYYRLMFGEPEQLEHSENHPKELVRRLSQTKEPFPRIFMACGTEDFLLENNRDFNRFLTEYHVEHQYLESEGNHDFTFWNQYLDIALKWLVDNEEEQHEKTGI